MAIVKPFRALRPIPVKAKEVSSVPYDVVNSKEASLLAKGNPVSFLHVVKPEIDLPEGIDLYDDRVYEQAKINLNRLIESGVLIMDDEPGLYIYKLKMENHEQFGIAACCSVDEYDNDIIVKHEHTRKEKEDDRTRHILTLSAHAGPVLLTYRGIDEINEIVKKEIKNKPLYDFKDEDGIDHTIWKVVQTKEIEKAFKKVQNLYIADGHHRAASASRVKKEMIKKNPDISGEEEFNYFLAVLFPKEQLQIFPYNRFINDTDSLKEDEFLNAIKEKFAVEKSGESTPKSKGKICMYMKGEWYGLNIKNIKIKDDPVESLDLSIFQHEILEPIFGIKDQRIDKRIAFIGGSGSEKKIEKRVDNEGGIGFTFYPVSVDELLAVSDAKKVMPPKSTWFAPKLRSGLLIHSFQV